MRIRYTFPVDTDLIGRAKVFLVAVTRNTNYFGPEMQEILSYASMPGPVKVPLSLEHISAAEIR